MYTAIRRRLTFGAIFVVLVSCINSTTSLQNGSRDENDDGDGKHTPVLTGASLSDGPYFVESTLTVLPGEATDPDGDAVTLQYQWYVNDVAVEGADSDTLSGAFQRGDKVKAAVTPSDGSLLGAPVTTETITIENRPPTAPAVVLSPRSPTAQTSKLWVTISTPSTDPDGDAVSYVYAWYKNGVKQGFPENQTTIAAPFVSADTWRVAVTASDGLAESPQATTETTIRMVAKAIGIHAAHACALTSEEAVWCWGFHGPGPEYGIYEYAPVPVAGLASGVKAISGGPSAYHTCAVNSTGGVKCWGRNYSGQLGDGKTNEYTPIPVDVSGLTAGVKAVAVGGAHSCALLENGAVRCWGYNFYGQLGGSSVSVDVPGLEGGVRSLALGGEFSCAVTSAGGVKCWGLNYNGQLGDGSTTNRYSPVDVSGLASGYVQVSAGNTYACALSATGEVKCWGKAIHGSGVSIESKTPVSISGLSGVSSISANHTSCALKADRSLRCWGGNGRGEAGTGEVGYSATPAPVAGLNREWQAVGVGDQYACALETGGGVYCWGGGDSGALGHGRKPYETNPTPVVLVPEGIQSMALGAGHTCAVTVAGAAKCWGDNNTGQAGNGRKVTLEPIATTVSGLSSGVRSLAAGDDFTCALTVEGAVQCWGANHFGQLGINEAWSPDTPGYAEPQAVVGLSSGVSSVFAGRYQACVLTGGSVQCWGNLPFVTYPNCCWISPGLVQGAATGVSAFSMDDDGRHYYCSITSGGVVKCRHEDAANFELVAGLPNGIVSVHTSPERACAIDGAGGLWCWGWNYYGQLGGGYEGLLTRSAIQPLGLSSGVVSVALGDAHTCALLATGRVKCWGLNDYGQLGIGNELSQTSPVDVPGLANIASIYARDRRTCAVTVDSKAYCWGTGWGASLGTRTLETLGWVPYVPVAGFVD